jgi:CBS domain containing-hemolysin-like protein
VVSAVSHQPTVVGRHAIFHGLIRRLSGQREEDRRADEEEAFESEIMTMVTAGQREGLLEEDAREMIEGVFELDDADVAEIMTPRSQVDMLDIHWPWPQVLQHVIRTRRTRLPVFDRHRDDIIGVLHVKDLLPELAKAPSEDKRPLRTLLRRPWFVPRSKPVDDLLQEFLDNRQHLAIVVDEYHAVAGVVTIEDVLEEIVGEIVDEFDRHEEPVERIQRLNETQVEVDGAVHVDELNEELGLDLPESDEFDTIAGLVISQLGYIPAVGESLQTNGVRITVAAANGRRLQKVIVETASDASNEPV